MVRFLMLLGAELADQEFFSMGLSESDNVIYDAFDFFAAIIGKLENRLETEAK